MKLSMIPGILKSVHKCQPDVVHANDATSGFALSLGYSPRLVVTVHGIGFSKADWPFPFSEGIRVMQSRAVTCAKEVVATDKVTAATVSGLRNEIIVIPPGIDVDAYDANHFERPAELRTDRFNILFAGRLTGVKGFDLAIRGISRLSPEFRRMTRLVVIGSGPMEELIPLAKARNDVEISYLGALPHHRLHQFFTNCDMLIQPSRSEGVPVSMLEAMAARLPVAASLVGGVGALFGGDELMPIDELTPEGIANAVTAVLSDRSSAILRVEKARERVESEFSLDLITERYLDVYRGVSGGY